MSGVSFLATRPSMANINAHIIAAWRAGPTRNSLGISASEPPRLNAALQHQALAHHT